MTGHTLSGEHALQKIHINDIFTMRIPGNDPEGPVRFSQLINHEIRTGEIIVDGELMDRDDCRYATGKCGAVAIGGVFNRNAIPWRESESCQGELINTGRGFFVGDYVTGDNGIEPGPGILVLDAVQQRFYIRQLGTGGNPQPDAALSRLMDQADYTGPG